MQDKKKGGNLIVTAFSLCLADCYLSCIISTPVNQRTSLSGNFRKRF